MTPAPSPAARRAPARVAVALAMTAALAAPAAAAAANPYAAGQVVVQYAPRTTRLMRARIARTAGAADATAATPSTRVLTLARGESVPGAIARLRREHGVLWAVPDYIAHAADAPATTTTSAATTTTPGPGAGTTSATTTTPGAGTTSTTAGATSGSSSTTSTSAVTTTSGSTSALPPPLDPNDPGIGTSPGGWAAVQWDFTGQFGVGAEQAWGNLAADGAPGGQGVIVAVLDTGVAYKNWGRFRQSPDLTTTRFVRGFDFIDPGAYPVDHNGHGTHVASTIAESTNNGYGLTGLAYGATLMSVRVLDSSGEGDAAVIAQGVRFAVNRGAKVINMSLEFDPGVTAADIPELISAIRYAHRRGVVVVAAAGNEGTRTIAYPARAPYVISVGATTQHGCLADYSNDGPQLSLVAPGGGGDADLPNDPNCHPNAAPGGDIYQVTFLGPNPRKFGIPPGYDGTSMAAPHVSATAALVIASKVLGRNPTPDAILNRLTATATTLGAPGDHSRYGGGLVNAAAATDPGGPGAVAQAATG